MTVEAYDMVGWRLEGSERKSSRVGGGWRLPEAAMCGGTGEGDGTKEGNGRMGGGSEMVQVECGLGLVLTGCWVNSTRI